MRRVIAYHLADLRAKRDEDTPQLDDPLPDGARPSQPFGLLSGQGLAAVNAQAWTVAQRGDQEGAIAILEAARDEHADGDERILGVLASNIGMAHYGRGRIEDALRELRAARELHLRAAAPQELATDCFNLGAILMGQNDVDGAAAYLAEAWQTLRAASIRSPLTVRVLSTLGLARMGQGDRRRARAAAEKALDVYENLRPNLAETEVEHMGMLETYRSALELLLYLSIDEGWTGDAVALIERGKGRFWAEEVARRRQAVGRDDGARRLGLDRDPEDWRGGWEDSVRTVAGPDTVVLSFLVGPHAMFRVAARNTRIGARRRDVGAAALEALVDEARYEWMAAGGRAARPEAARRELAELVLGDLPVALADTRLVVVLADGPLWAAAFDGLPVPGGSGETLSDVAPVVVCPSLEILRELQSREAAAGELAWRPLVVADPRVASVAALAGARRQVDALQEAVGPLPRERTLVGDAATRDRALAAMADATHLHFATHAFGGLDDVRPHLMLSDGSGGPSPLYADEIAALRLSADVVFLSACSTSLGRPSTGEGMTSLARAFLLAGARCVVATLWSVADEEAARVTGRFYAELRDGTPVARALRDARLAARRDGVSARTWAAVQLVGDGDAWRERAYYTVEKALADPD
jgi:tetratricopeptide (TPR) repeat protein